MITRSTQHRNQEGDPPGGGAPITPVPAPAQGAPQFVTLEQAQALVAAGMLEARNGAFAEFRRAGGFKGDKPDSGTGAPVAPTVIPPTNGAPAAAIVPVGFVAAADVERMIERSNAVIRIASQNHLSDNQVTRMQSALKAANPDDAVTWTKSYLEDFGLLKGAPTTAPPATVAPTIPIPQQLPGQLTPPISDKGAPASGNPGGWKDELATNPIGVMQGGVFKDRMIAELGFEKANSMIVAAVRTHRGGVKVDFSK